jgi:hypothetical protein
VAGWSSNAVTAPAASTTLASRAGIRSDTPRMRSMTR